VVGPLVAVASEVVDEVREVEADVFVAVAGPGNGRRCGVDGAVLSRSGQTMLALLR
jgi:hypothetical protein